MGIFSRLKTHPKRYWVPVLCLFLAFWCKVLCSPGSEVFWYMTVLVGGLFAFANIPSAVGRAITRRLVFQDSEIEQTEAFIHRQLRRMEWVRFFPLKRVLAAGLWLFCPVMAIMGMLAFLREPEKTMPGMILLFLGVAVLTAKRTWRYVTTPCHCVPVLNKVLSKQEIEKLLQGEKFELVPFENADLQKYIPVLVSENWMFVEGFLISRKLLLGGTVLRDGVTSGGINRKASRLVFFYLNGSQFQTRKTHLYLDGKRYDELKNALGQISPVSIPSSTATEAIVKKYNAILPEIQEPKEKLWYLLTHDLSDIRQEYEALSAPKQEPHKKKRSQKAAERNR